MFTRKLLTQLFFALALIALIFFIYNNISLHNSSVIKNEQIVAPNHTTKVITPPVSTNFSMNSSPLAQQSEDVEDNNEQETNTAIIFIEKTNWRLNGKLTDHYQQLLNLANQQDSDATYLLAMNLQYCSRAVETEEAHGTSMSLAISEGEHDNIIEQSTQRFRYCFGISRSQKNQFIDWLEQAASQGHVRSQEAFANITPSQYMGLIEPEKLEREAYIQQRDAFIEKQHSYLHSAAQQGSFHALQKLSGLHYNQKIKVASLVHSYAYNHAILAFTDDNTLYNRYNWYQQKYNNTMPATDIEQAMIMAEQLINEINNSGTIYR